MTESVLPPEEKLFVGEKNKTALLPRTNEPGGGNGWTFQRIYEPIHMYASLL